MDEQQRVESDRVQMKQQRKAKSRRTAMGLDCSCRSGENESFNRGGSASLEPVEGCTKFSPKEPQTQQDYEDLIYLLGGETRWLHIKSQD